jgi:hypothetical protein
MAIPTRSNNNSMPSTVSTPARGFVPPAVTSDDLVTVMILFRKSSTRESILQTDAQGKERGQVLGNLVGVVLPVLDEAGNTVLNEKGEMVMTCYPDPDGKTKLPPIDSEGFKRTMAMGTGIFVESIFSDGIKIIRDLAAKGFLGGITTEAVDKAVGDNTLNRLLENRGSFLRSIPGIFERHELTVLDIMSGEKTLSMTFFGEEANAFSDSYNRLQDTFKFQNIALVCQMSSNVQATQLTAGISYQADELHFHYKQTSVGTRTQYMLDPEYAKSGKVYSAQTVNAGNAADLARNGSQTNYDRNVSAIQQGSNTRLARRNEQLIRALNGGQAAPAPSDMDLV